MQCRIESRLPPQQSGVACDEATQRQLAAAIMRVRVADAVKLPAAELERRWGPQGRAAPPRHCLFVRTQSGHVYPAFSCTVEAQSAAASAYCEWAGLRPDDYGFWIEYVDALSGCYEFDKRASDAVRAWAYGRLCQLAIARHRRYDPQTNWTVY